ncbi:Pectinesterase inhibitor [Quillaja saponaria]|uniref:Pectinesterase inhibitor n=1 Tax=Quillaja saponaria TaxID=32244 RepID=A0AAD7QF97_QUISA|nr:Pectinesterase inhibitor [Quillaja saponaria]
MKNLACLFSLSEIVLLTVLLFESTQPSVLRRDENGDLIDQTCKQTPYSDLCVSSLKSNPQSSNTDLKGLALVMVNNVLANATETLNYIEGLIKQTTDQQLEQALAFCAELYIPVVKYSLPEAADAVSHGRFGFANYGISDAGNEAVTCEKKFSGSAKSPLTDRNKFVQKLSDVAAAILDQLLKG